MRTRQLGAFAAVIVVLIVIVLVVNAVRTSSNHDALKRYQGDVVALADESRTQVGAQLFGLLSGAAHKSPTDTQTRLNALHVLAQQEVARAQDLGPPGAMRDAQTALVLALGLRSDAVGGIAGLEQQAVGMGGNGVNATARAAIADQMRLFLASDVVYARRVVPGMRRALDRGGLRTQQIAPVGGFLPDSRWLSPAFVTARLGASGAPAAKRRKPAPGTHGHELTSVRAGGVTLVPGATNRLIGGPHVAFSVSVLNQGSNPETGVAVRVRITGGGPPLEASRTIARTGAGQPASVTIPLPLPPPAGRPVTIAVTVAPVPGESTIQNNTRSYPAVFAG